jgi:hypothetical protein
MMTRQAWPRAACFLLALAWCGCGPSARPGQLTGKVRFRGSVMPSGTVTFLGADGKSLSAVIAQDGTYVVSGVAPGVAKISVEYHTRAPRGLGGGPGTIDLPRHYANPETSGLTCEVSGGPQTFDIELKPADAERPGEARAAGTPRPRGASR